MTDYDHNANNEQTARDMLDNFLFEDIINNFIRGKGGQYWQVTWEGDDFVLLHEESGDLYHFRVAIEPHEWDSAQAIADQEWFE